MGVNILYINEEALEGIYVDASQSYNKPARSASTFNIPGRNGALVLDNGTFDNVLIPYPCYIKNGFNTAFSALVNKLGNMKGYQRIECSDDPTHYREGRVVLPQTPDVHDLNTAGFFTLSFDCKPQRFLLSGETRTRLQASGTINNPTNNYARPTLEVYGSGSFSINDVSITVENNTVYTIIDSELQECFYNTTSKNNDVSFSGNDFPLLKPGNNVITFGSGITDLYITPHWWEL